MKKSKVYTNVQQEDTSIVEQKDDEESSKTDEEFVLDELAWKKVKSDVFRRPKCSMLFAILVGTGIQIFAMLFFLILFAMVGINQKDYRSILVFSLYVLFILLSNLSGYFTARFYKMF